MIIKIRSLSTVIIYKSYKVKQTNCTQTAHKYISKYACMYERNEALSSYISHDIFGCTTGNLAVSSIIHLLPYTVIPIPIN